MGKRVRRTRFGNIPAAAEVKSGLFYGGLLVAVKGGLRGRGPVKAAAAFVVALFLIFLSGCGELSFPKQYALVYGVADYAGGSNDLNYTDDDAREISSLLSSKGYTISLRYTDPSGPDHTSPPPDRATFFADLSSMASTLNPEDMLIVYFSGHGGQAQSTDAEPTGRDADAEFIALYDPLAIENGFVFDDELAEALAEIPAALKIVIIDACNSGGFIGTSPQVDIFPQDYQGSSLDLFTSMSQAISLYLYFPSTAADIPYSDAIVLSASGEAELSYESSSFSNGIFSYYFLESAGKGDKNSDGYLTLLEAYEYSSDKIKSFSSLSYLPRISGGAVDFVLFKAD